MRYGILAVAIVAAVSLRAADTSGSKRCGHACLQGFVDSYLDALAKHDPSTLPVAPSVKFTENGKALKLGEGFWKTAGASAYRLYALDPKARTRRHKPWWKRMAGSILFSFA